MLQKETKYPLHYQGIRKKNKEKVNLNGKPMHVTVFIFKHAEMQKNLFVLDIKENTENENA